MSVSYTYYLYCRILPSDDSIVDLSSWLNECKQISSVNLSPMPHTKAEMSPIQFEDGLQLDTCYINLGEMTIEQQKEALEFFNCLTNHRDHVKKLYLTFDEKLEPDVVIKFLELLNRDEEIKITKRVQFCDQSSQLIQEKLSQHWKYTEYLNSFSLDCLETLDLSVFRHLDNMYLYVPSDEQRTTLDCSFLDPIRTTLHTFNLRTLTQSFFIPSTMFSGMTNLQGLYLSGNLMFELNNQSKLFADLTQLMALDIGVNETMLTTECLIELPMLSSLRLLFSTKDLQSTTLIRPRMSFKVPKLEYLNVHFDYMVDFTSMSSYFTRAGCISITTNVAHKISYSWMKQFDKARSSTLTLEGTERIDSEIFDDFKHVTKLTLPRAMLISLDRGTLSKLVRVESVTIKSEEKFQLKEEDKSLFDGLGSLREISFGVGDIVSKSFLFFKNLGRHIMVCYKTF